MKRMLLCLILMPLALCLLSGCKERMPKDVLPEREMENLLYDYHLAQAMAEVAESPDSVSYRKRLYLAAVFSKHHASEQQFERSMAWYTRHSERLFDIYKRIDKRFSESTSALGAGASSSPLAVVGDTANIWQGRQFLLLSSSGDNRFSFEQHADTAFHSGDRLTWHFTTQWVYKEGMKSAAAVMYVRYDNDSVAVATQNVYSSGHQQVSLVLGKQPVRSVGGFIYQNAPWSQRPKLLLLSQIALIRYRGKQEPAEPVRDSLSVRPVGMADSLPVRQPLPDSLSPNPDRIQTPHFREVEDVQPGGGHRRPFLRNRQ